MTKVTSQSMVDVTVIGADGEARTLKAGATENISFDSKHRHNQGLIFAGAVRLEGAESASGEKAARKSAPRKPAPRKAPAKAAAKAPQKSSAKAANSAPENNNPA